MQEAFLYYKASRPALRRNQAPFIGYGAVAAAGAGAGAGASFSPE